MRGLMRRRPYVVLALAIVAILGCLVWVVLVLGHPLPPRTVVMTTGTERGIYREFGEKYRAALARHGISLELKQSSGNIENLARLKDPSSGVTVGFVAGGLPNEKDSPEIESLGTISYVPPFGSSCRDVPSGAGFLELRGKRVSIDVDSGVLPELLRAIGLEGQMTLVPMDPDAGGEALLRGEIDCASMLTVTDASIREKATRRRQRESNELSARRCVHRALSVSAEGHDPSRHRQSRQGPAADGRDPDRVDDKPSGKQRSAPSHPVPVARGSTGHPFGSWDSPPCRPVSRGRAGRRAALERSEIVLRLRRKLSAKAPAVLARRTGHAPVARIRSDCRHRLSARAHGPRSDRVCSRNGGCMFSTPNCAISKRASTAECRPRTAMRHWRASTRRSCAPTSRRRRSTR